MKITRKLIIPLLIFLAVVLVLVQGYQNRRDTALIVQQEEQSMANAAGIFQNRLDSLEAFALALAMEVANNPEVQEAFAAKDRERLIELTLPAYLQIDSEFDVPQHQFHLPPATSFLRLHQLDRFDDDLSTFRNTVLQANASGQSTSGPEIGRGGLGIRGVVPVSYEDQHVGTVEFGLNVDQSLINMIKGRFGDDWQILLRQDPAEVAIFEGAVAGAPGPTPELFLQASTLAEPVFASPEIYAQVLDGQKVFSPQVEQNDQSFEIYSAPLLDFSGETIGVVEVIRDRAPLVSQQFNRNLYFVISTIAILVVTGLGLGFIVQRMLKPIGGLTETATAIAAGDLDNVVAVKSNDEIGMMATAFNSMTAQLRNLIGSLEQRVQERTRALETSTEVSRQLSTILEQERLIKEVVHQIQTAFGYYHVHIYLVDEKSEQLILAGGTGEAGRAMLANNHKVPVGQGLVGRAAAFNASTLVADVTKDKNWLANPLLPDTKSEAAIPIAIGSKMLGVLDVQHNLQNGLQENDMVLLRSIANQVAIALQNAQQYQQTQESEARTQTILDSINVPVLITNLADGKFFYFNDPGLEAVGLTRDQLTGRLTSRFYHDLADREKFITILKERGAVNNYELQLQRINGEVFWAMMSARVISFEGEPAVFTMFLEITDRKKAETLLAKQASELQTVAEINTVAMSIPDTQEMLSKVINLIKERFDLYHAHMYLLDQTGNFLLLTAGAGEVGQQMVQEQHHIELMQPRSLVAQAARTKKHVLVNDVSENPDHLPNPLLPNTRAELTVPLVVGDQVIGVLDVQSDKENYFSPADVNIQSTLANQLAASIQIAQALEDAERSAFQLNTLTKRLTREGWDEFLSVKSPASQFGFGYDLKQVSPISLEDKPDVDADAILNQPIRIQGTEVGALNIADPQALSKEAQEIIVAVSERLGAHIENLRLTEQTQNALSYTEALFAGSERVVRANSIQDVLIALVNSTSLGQMERASISLFDKPWDQNPENLTIFSRWTADTGLLKANVKTVMPVAQFPAITFLEQNQEVRLENVDTNLNIDEATRAVFRELNICSLFALPLIVGDQWFGIVSGQSSFPVHFDDEVVRQIKGLTDQAAVVAQSLLLFEDAQARAQREQLLREVTARIHAAPDAESVLRTAAQEVNRTLGLEAFVYLEEPEIADQTNGIQTNGSK